jgi:hypothetical protein
MTAIEIKILRQKISKLFVEYGRVKGFLEIKGTKIDTPQSVFIGTSEVPKDSFIFEIDGLNQVWNTTERLRDKIEEIIDGHENINFSDIDTLIDSWLVQAYDALNKVERSIIVKTK